MAGNAMHPFTSDVFAWRYDQVKIKLTESKLSIDVSDDSVSYDLQKPRLLES